MRKTVMPFVLSIGLIAVWVPPADAASTRAEYIAQVDPICQGFVGPVNDAARGVRKNFTAWERLSSTGTQKQFVRQTKRTARSFLGLSEVNTRLTDRIATVSAPAQDATLIGTWLDQRRESIAFATLATKAFRHFNFKASERRFDRAGAAQGAARDTISGFGFQVCGVNPAA